MFIEIAKFGEQRTVTEEFFNSYLKKKGWKKVQNKNKKVEQEQQEVQEVVEEQKVDVETIPISEMTREELVAFAEKNGIDLTGVRNTKEAREVIRKAVNPNKK